MIPNGNSTENNGTEAATAATEQQQEQVTPAPAADVSVLIAERDSWKDKAYRAAADAENARKRAAADLAEARQYAVTGFARDMLAVADNLLRAISAPEGNEKALREGVAMTAAQLEQTLLRFGVKKIEVKPGDALNPEFHQAMGQMDAAAVPGCEGFAAGAIIQEVQAGFTLNGRLLRPSLVMVVK